MRWRPCRRRVLLAGVELCARILRERPNRKDARLRHTRASLRGRKQLQLIRLSKRTMRICLGITLYCCAPVTSKTINMWAMPRNGHHFASRAGFPTNTTASSPATRTWGSVFRQEPAGTISVPLRPLAAAGLRRTTCARRARLGRALSWYIGARNALADV